MFSGAAQFAWKTQWVRDNLDSRYTSPPFHWWFDAPGGKRHEGDIGDRFFELDESPVRPRPRACWPIVGWLLHCPDRLGPCPLGLTMRGLLGDLEPSNIGAGGCRLELGMNVATEDDVRRTQVARDNCVCSREHQVWGNQRAGVRVNGMLGHEFFEIRIVRRHERIPCNKTARTQGCGMDSKQTPDAARPKFVEGDDLDYRRMQLGIFGLDALQLM